ncbi:hypothetical protein S40293_05730 [Stachybotrys chartarum IBT 40293]|nr:hypothetical protein S40293_05730 [Stachybotrys chartarum IBT 40293]
MHLHGDLGEVDKTVAVGGSDTVPGCDDGPINILTKFPDNDPENPYNWSTRKKLFIITTTSMTLFNSTLASSLPANAMHAITAEFGVAQTPNNPQLALPISLFLAGYIFGPLLFGPLSETSGRRQIMFVAFSGYTAFTLGCALAPNWAVLLVFRLLCGVFASAPLAAGAGIIADIYNDPVVRGRGMTYFYAGNIFAPLIAPAISGYISETTTWRWVFWVGVIVAGASWVPLVFLPETYGPVLLARRAKSLRKQAAESGQGNSNMYAPIEMGRKSWHAALATILARPVQMFFTELIVSTTSVYMALAYAVYYMFFQTYPIIFRDIYGMTPGFMGLMYLPIGAGIVLGLITCLLWDAYLARARNAAKAWAFKEEYRRLPLACFGGPLYVVGLFWLGWTAREDISWAVPCVAGIPFGMGNFLVSIALLNYLSDAYGVYSASVMAASSCTRSIFGTALPLGSGQMYASLGVGWATSLIGFISLAMCGVPFVFIYYGDVIRGRSKFSQAVARESLAVNGNVP